MATSKLTTQKLSPKMIVPTFTFKEVKLII